MNRFESMSKRRRALLLAALALVGITVVLVAIECVLRLNAYARNGFARVDDVYMVDRSNGLRVPRPSMKFGGININSDGFRGPEIQTPKPAGMLRLAFVGASTTFCAEVGSDAKTWPDLVARDLQRRHPQWQVDYVNAAVPGYGIDAMHKSFVSRVARFHPDVAIVYEATNNIASDTRTLALERHIIEERPKWSRWLTDRSSLAQLLYLNASVWSLARQDRHGTRARLDLTPSDLLMLRAGYRERLVSLIRSAQQSARVVAVATFSHRVRHANAPADGTAEAALVLMTSRAEHLSIKGLMDAYDAYNDAIRDAAAATGAVLIDGNDEIPGDFIHFVDTMHFSEAGSAAMAKRVLGTLNAAEPFQRVLAALSAEQVAPRR
jgi:lysophospholipase L1-like esterase